jgi:hypothetical protein
LKMTICFSCILHCVPLSLLILSFIGKKKKA